MRRGPCRAVPRGWSCDYGHGHNGSCPARPAWWNLTGQRRVARAAPRPASEPPSWLLIAGLALLLLAALLAVVTAR